ncbi:c4a25b2a-df96-4365-8639-3b801177d029 [Thermothielavioides terrestris]|uniref:C4a25b2a-df96-4365-8639-3b801177d029 n=1 Tax=Thermothielavioides terrestris TaxID=2587410 RepID=A0A3S4AKZ8_9PEZI|nr:c4a25b2a-df96-4365-8639-3b801177d029 [Thermothielavioides terrestris]
MSSRFVSAGAIDAATGQATTTITTTTTTNNPPAPLTKKQQEWAAATAQLEADRQRRALQQQQQRGAGEKSLYEVLQANKAAKQAAFEEAHRLRNQFRALDDDEVEFLDEVRMRARRQEEEARREVERGLEGFRRRAQAAAGGEV